MDDRSASELDPERATFLSRVAVSALVDHVAAEVATAFRAEDIRSILLKGPATTSWLYDDLLERVYGDADFLVAPEQLGDARKVLGGLGFTREELGESGIAPRPHAEMWTREAVIDLHYTLSGVRASPETVWTALAEKTEWLKVNGVEVEVLAPGSKALLVVLHAAHHGPVAVLGIRDLNRALERVPLEVWRQAAFLAQRLDATAAFGAGLRLTAKGSELAEQLEVGRERSLEVELRAASAPTMALRFAWLSKGAATRRQKLIFVLRKLFPPAEFIRATSPLAARGPLGFAAARIARPFALLGRIPRAVRAYRRARLEARADG